MGSPAAQSADGTLQARGATLGPSLEPGTRRAVICPSTLPLDRGASATLSAARPQTDEHRQLRSADRAAGRRGILQLLVSRPGPQTDEHRPTAVGSGSGLRQPRNS